jgi:hypothetical protein
VKPCWAQGAEIQWGTYGSSMIKKFRNHSEIVLEGFVSDTTFRFIARGENETIIEITESDPKGGMFFTDGGVAEISKWEDNLLKLKNAIEKGTSSHSDGQGVTERSAFRTIREFAISQPIWEFLDKWSREYGFQLIQAEQDFRLYKKGSPALKAPLWVEISQSNSFVHLEVWLSIDEATRTFYRQSTFSIIRLRPEYGIESGGYFGRIPRKQYRKEVNTLLAYFGQPRII